MITILVLIHICCISMFSCFCFTTNARCRLRRLSGSPRPFGLNSDVFPHFKPVFPGLLLLMGLSYCTLWYHSMSLASNRCESSHNQSCTLKLSTTFWFIELILFIIQLISTSLQISTARGRYKSEAVSTMRRQRANNPASHLTNPKHPNTASPHTQWPQPK